MKQSCVHHKLFEINKGDSETKTTSLNWAVQNFSMVTIAR